MLRLTVPWIWAHPLGRRHRLGSFLRYLRWQAHSRYTATPLVMPWVNGTRLLLEQGMSGATGNFYCGLHEWPDMAFVLHLLRPGDTFADIGANVGSYTVLASGAVGCRSESFEPVPTTFQRLLRQVAANGLEPRVITHQAAMGAAAGELRFSTDRDAMNHVVGSSYSGESMLVPVLAIDHLPSLRHACCWKLDVEGHESAVLAGATRTLAEAPPAAILCEDRSPAVQHTLTAAGFQPCAYNPLTRKLRPDSGARGGNQLWVRDLAWTQQRLQTAPAFTVLGEHI